MTEYLPLDLPLPTLPPLYPSLSTTTSSSSFSSTPFPLITLRCHKISYAKCKLKS